MWNDKGFNGYFCPEPMSAMIDAPNLDLPADLTGYRELAPNESTTFHQHFRTVV
jgi:aldose 1-epimerase